MMRFLIALAMAMILFAFAESAQAGPLKRVAKGAKAGVGRVLKFVRHPLRRGC